MGQRTASTALERFRGDRGTGRPRGGLRGQELVSQPCYPSQSWPPPLWPPGRGLCCLPCLSQRPLWHRPRPDSQVPPRSAHAGGSVPRVPGPLTLDRGTCPLCVPRPHPTMGSTPGRKSSCGSGSAWGSLASPLTTSTARAASSSSRPATASSTVGTGARTASW